MAWPPPRRPDYLAEYSDDAALERAIRRRQRLGKKLGKPTRPFRPLRATVDGVDPNCRTRVITSAHGHIDRILLTVPPSSSPRLPVDKLDARHLRTLIRALDGEGRIFIIVCHDDQVTEVNRWLDEANVGECRCGKKLPHRKNCPRQIVRSVWNNTIWAQDPYVALEATGEGEGGDGRGRALDSYGAMLCDGVLFHRKEDQTLASDVSAQTETLDLHSNLYFQGGNILATPELALIGKDYVWSNVGRCGLPSEGAVLRHFQELLGRRCIKLGTEEPLPAQVRSILTGTYQPVFHIDMFVTPTGVLDGTSKKEIVLFGMPDPSEFSFATYFEPVREQLRKHFEVREIPLVPQFSKIPLSPQSSQENANSWFYHLTWNNAVVENYTTKEGQVKRVVYLPTYVQGAKGYGLDPELRRHFDNEAQRIWRDVGFEVIRLDGQEDLAHSFGAIHCTTKVLCRSGYQPNFLRTPEA